MKNNNSKTKSDILIEESIKKLRRDVERDIQSALRKQEKYIRNYTGKDKDLKHRVKTALKNAVYLSYRTHCANLGYEDHEGQINKMFDKDTDILSIIKDEGVRADFLSMKKAYEMSLRQIDRCIDDNTLTSLINGSHEAKNKEKDGIVTKVVYGVMMALSFSAMIVCIVGGGLLMALGGAPFLLTFGTAASLLAYCASGVLLTKANFDYAQSIPEGQIESLSNSIIDNTLESYKNDSHIPEDCIASISRVASVTATQIEQVTSVMENRDEAMNVQSVGDKMVKELDNCKDML